MTYFRKMFRVLQLTALSLLVLFGSQLGATETEAADLKHNVMIDGDVIRLGDLFKGAGEAADFIISPAPLPGKSLTISFSDLERVTNSHNIKWERPIGMFRATITRSGQDINDEEVMALVEEALLNVSESGNYKISFYGRQKKITLPISASFMDLEINNFRLDEKSGRFSAEISYPTGSTTQAEVKLSGKAERLITVPVLAQSIAKDEVIKKSDLKWVEKVAARVGQNTLLHTANIYGKVARRNLKPNDLLRPTDLTQEILIKKGTLVAMTISAGAMTISTVGRAMDNGGQGDMIRLLNTASHQTVDGIVTGHDKVKIVTRNQIAMANK